MHHKWRVETDTGTLITSQTSSELWRNYQTQKLKAFWHINHIWDIIRALKKLIRRKLKQRRRERWTEASTNQRWTGQLSACMLSNEQKWPVLDVFYTNRTIEQLINMSNCTVLHIPQLFPKILRPAQYRLWRPNLSKFPSSHIRRRAFACWNLTLPLLTLQMLWWKRGSVNSEIHQVHLRKGIASKQADRFTFSLSASKVSVVTRGDSKKSNNFAESSSWIKRININTIYGHFIWRNWIQQYITFFIVALLSEILRTSQKSSNFSLTHLSIFSLTLALCFSCSRCHKH